MKKYLFIFFILVCVIEISFAQTTTTNNYRPSSPAFSGWDATSPNPGTYDVKNDFSYPINFWTNTNWHATLDVTGNFSIGQTSNTNYFGIGTTTPVLWHNGHHEDIFVAVGAGNSTMTGHYNSFMGNSAGASTSDGEKLTFLGFEAGKANTIGSSNTAIGYQAFTLSQETYMNTVVGYQALGGSTGCSYCWDGHSSINTAVGFKALYSTQAYGGCALGYMAGYSNTGGCSLVAVGEQAAMNNTLGDDNVAIGEGCMYANTTLGDNTAVGTDALANQGYTGAEKTSSYNTAVGRSALLLTNPSSTSDGYLNTGIGALAGATNVTGIDNSYLGYKADGSASNLNNTSAIGAGAVVTTDNNMILGNSALEFRVGIGLSGVAGGAQAKLHVENDATLPGGIGIAGLFHSGGTAPTSTAVYGLSDATSTYTNYGAQFYAHYGSNNVGVYGETTKPTTNDAYGVWGQSSNAAILIQQYGVMQQVQQENIIMAEFFYH